VKDSYITNPYSSKFKFGLIQLCIFLPQIGDFITLVKSIGLLKKIMNNKFWLLNIHRTILAEKKDTNGMYDLVEGVTQSSTATPLHVHTQYIETIYVVEGELTIYMEPNKTVLQPGNSYTIQKGHPHQLKATGNHQTKTLTIFSPSGFANVIRQAGIAGEANEHPDTVTDMGLFKKFSEDIGDLTLPIGTVYV